MKILFAPSVMEYEKLKAGTEALLEGVQQIPDTGASAQCPEMAGEKSD